MALNLKHNIEKIFDGNPYFFCFYTTSWFSKILLRSSKIFHSSLPSLAHRNILFHVILVHNFDLVAKQFTQIILICIFYCSPYSRRTLLMCPSHVLIEVTKKNKNKVFEFFLLRLKLLILSVWKFWLIYPNLATHSHATNTQCGKTYTKALE